MNFTANYFKFLFTGDYGRVSMKFVSSFFIANGTVLKRIGENITPLTFEQIGQENGFMLYETVIDKLFTDPAKLKITDIHDRAYVFVNKEPRQAKYSENEYRKLLFKKTHHGHIDLNKK